MNKKIIIQKSLYKIIAICITAFCMFSFVMTDNVKAEGVTARVVSGGGGKIKISGKIGKYRDNKQVSVMVYKAQNPDEIISEENAIEKILYIGSCTADIYGRYECVANLGTSQTIDRYISSGYRIAVGSAEDGRVSAISLKSEKPAVEISTGEFGNISFDKSEKNINIKITDKEKLMQKTRIITEIFDGTARDPMKNTLIGEDPYEGLTPLYTNAASPDEAEFKDGICDFNKVLRLGGDSGIPRYGIFDYRIKILADGVDEMIFTGTLSNVKGSTQLNRKMGTQYHYAIALPTTDQEDTVKTFATAGYGMARDGLHLPFYKKGKGENRVYTVPAYTRDFYEAAKKYNLDGMLGAGSADGENEILTRKDKDSNCYPKTAEELEAYSDYIYHMIFDTIEYFNTYEIMNEVNISGPINDLNYKTPMMEPYEYIAAVKTARASADKAVKDYNEIHGTNHKIKILGGALAYVTWQESNTVNWVQSLFNPADGDDLGKYIDGFTYHMYTNSDMPEESIMAKGKNGKKSIPEQISDIIKIKYPNMPITLSETGYSSSSGWKKEYSTEYDDFKYYYYADGTPKVRSIDCASEFRQAVYELRDMVLLYDTFDSIYFYCAVNKQHEDVYESCLGHLQTYIADKKNKTGVAYAAKPAFAVFANFNSLTANATIEKISDGVSVDGIPDKLYNYKFENSELGKSVNMIWTATNLDTKDGEYSHSAAYAKAYMYDYEYTTMAKSVTVYDMYGNSRMIVPQNNKVELSVGAAPIYVEESFDELNDIYATDINHSELTDGFGENNQIIVNVNPDRLNTFGNFLVCAVYSENGIAIDINVKPLAEVKDAGMAINVKGAALVKAFVFDNMSDIRPICKALTIPKVKMG